MIYPQQRNFTQRLKAICRTAANLWRGTHLFIIGIIICLFAAFHLQNAETQAPFLTAVRSEIPAGQISRLLPSA